MTPDEFRAELEEELRWRQEELAFFKNQLVDIVLENDADRYRKSLVLILYSHFEGYVKIALQTYIEYLNSLCVLQKDVVPALAASGMHKEFIAYENLDRKCAIFKTALPEDTALHRFYRRVDFIEQMNDFQNSVLHLEDSLIDTESNLWYVVLQTSVYKGYKRDKIEMRGDRAEMSDFPLYLNTVAGGLDRRDQTIGGFSFVVKIYAVPVVEIIG